MLTMTPTVRCPLRYYEGYEDRRDMDLALKEFTM